MRTRQNNSQEKMLNMGTRIELAETAPQYISIRVYPCLSAIEKQAGKTAKSYDIYEPNRVKLR